MSLIPKLKQTIGKLGLVGLIGFSSIGCGSQTKNYWGADGIIDNKEKVVLIDNLNSDSLVLPYSSELEISKNFLGDLNKFQSEKAKSQGFEIKTLQGLNLNVFQDKKEVGKVCMAETATACFFSKTPTIYIRSLPFLEFNEIMFHELGHFKHLTGDTKVNEAIAEYNRIYSEITAYQMDSKIGSYFVKDIFLGGSYPSMKIYGSFNQLPDYEAAYATAIFALNHFGSDIEETENFFLNSSSEEIRSIFEETIQKYPLLPLREIYFFEFKKILENENFLRQTWDLENSFRREEYVSFLKFNLYDSLVYVNENEGIDSESYKIDLMNQSIDFLKKNFPSLRFRNLVAFRLLPLFKKYQLDPFHPGSGDPLEYIVAAQDFFEYARSLPCDKTESFVCPPDVANSERFIVPVFSDVITNLNSVGQSNLVLDFTNLYLDKFFSTKNYSYTENNLSGAYFNYILHQAVIAALRLADSSEGLANKKDFMCLAKDYLDILKSGSCNNLLETSMKEACLKNRGDYTLVIESLDDEIDCN